MADLEQQPTTQGSTDGVPRFCLRHNDVSSLHQRATDSSSHRKQLTLDKKLRAVNLLLMTLWYADVFAIETMMIKVVQQHEHMLCFVPFHMA